MFYEYFHYYRLAVKNFWRLGQFIGHLIFIHIYFMFGHHKNNQTHCKTNGKEAYLCYSCLSLMLVNTSDSNDPMFFIFNIHIFVFVVKIVVVLLLFDTIHRSIIQ